MAVVWLGVCPSATSEYGKSHSKQFTQYFLEYKEMKGWGRIAIDPQSVPRELLLNRQSAPPRIGRGQPYQTQVPMTDHDANTYTAPAARVSQHPTPEDPQPASKSPGTPSTEDDFSSVGTPSGVRLESMVSPSIKSPASFFVPGKEHPLVTDPSLFVIGDDEEEEGDDDIPSKELEEGGIAKGREATPPLYNAGDLPRGFVVPELAHLVPWRRPRFARRSSDPEIKQPAPKTPQTHVGHVGSLSNVNLVNNLTEIAKDIDIPNYEYIEYEGRWVPRIMTPPKGKHRSPTPTPPLDRRLSHHSATEHVANPGRDSQGSTNIGKALTANVVPDSLIPGGGHIPREDNGVPTYYVVTHLDSRSPTGASAFVRRSPSHESVTIPPPQRLDGILIPPVCLHHASAQEGESTSTCAACRGAFFKERGLPTQSYMREEQRSATLAEAPPPVLVSFLLAPFTTSLPLSLAAATSAATSATTRHDLQALEWDSIDNIFGLDRLDKLDLARPHALLIRAVLIHDALPIRSSFPPL
ncbi:hypothetical protein NUW58_g8762 [Xylaria curta]|uniref:Uncharacterized protein n=1 Tax=Xylaria curta TaxID=42375 RepID=A0ACC1N662_9PEZI|nr:hypothetical protein NUW58_g8762 [Xylaria curta]